MSGETLRRAAALMRERAEAATSGPGAVCSAPSLADAEHIASWHPAVALAVADWLDAIVTRIPEIEPHYEHCLDREQTAALAVARAYLDVRP